LAPVGFALAAVSWGAADEADAGVATAAARRGDAVAAGAASRGDEGLDGAPVPRRGDAGCVVAIVFYKQCQGKVVNCLGEGKGTKSGDEWVR